MSNSNDPLLPSHDEPHTSDGETSDPLMVNHTDDDDEQPKAQQEPPPPPILSRYTQFVASASNRDKLLKVLQWTLTFWKSAWTQKLSLELSFARYVSRLVEWPTALDALQNDCWKADTTLRSTWIGRILALTMMAYYPLEHAAYLQWMKPKYQGRTAERLSYWSCRFWVAYIVTDLFQNVMQLKQQQQQQAKDNDNSDAKKIVHNTQLQLARNCFFLLPGIHWSLSEWDRSPWLSNTTVNYCMWAEAITSLVQAVRNSQLLG